MNIDVMKTYYDEKWTLDTVTHRIRSSEKKEQETDTILFRRFEKKNQKYFVVELIMVRLRALPFIPQKVSTSKTIFECLGRARGVQNGGANQTAYWTLDDLRLVVTVGDMLTTLFLLPMRVALDNGTLVALLLSTMVSR